MNPTLRYLFGAGIICLLLFLAAGSSPATEGWLPVSPDDLALKDNPKQPGADAMILYRELVDDASKASSSGDTVEEYVRIKIFTQAGAKYGHIEIQFSKAYQNVVYVAGRTIKPDGPIEKFDGQVLETTVEKAGGLKVLAKTFTLPDVQPGCIVEYKYQLQGQPGWVHSHEWIVARPMYTREAHFTYIPDTGYDNGLHPMYSTYLLPADAVLKQQVNGTFLMVVHDVPGVVPESLMPPERPIEARVNFFYQDPDAPAPSDPSDRYWNHYGKKWDAQLEHFIDKKGALDDDLSKIAAPNDAPEIKLRKIYARVQQIRNLSFEDEKMKQESKDEQLKPNANVEDVLKHGYAYSSEIDYLFVGLARAAGFDATEIFLAPRNVEMFLPNRNDVDQLSDEIVWVRAGTQEYYLDPGAQYFPFGLLPWYETEAGGIKVDKHGGTIVNTPAGKSSDATLVRNADLQVKDDGSIAGTVQIDFAGQRGALMREENWKEDETGRIKLLEDEVKAWLPIGAEFKVTKIADWGNDGLPVHVEGTLSLPSFANSAERRMLMPLEIFQPTQISEFASEKRFNFVYIHYAYEEIDDIKLRMPPGYKVVALPPGRNINLGAVTYQIAATAQDNALEVKRHLVEQGVIFTKEQYPVLRNFFGTVRAGDDAQMVIDDAASAKN